MTPTGYFRKVEAFALYLRDHDETARDDADMDRLVNAIDQSWTELSHDEQLVVYNVVQFINKNIRPTAKPAPDEPRIQLVN